ncbi:MAG: hypothetical protein KJZ73_12115 [Pseudorhodoplanes sp.]|nr:hypothetical protein [Pseudorhodoplanes sp.]MBW7950479.1 hypothetical protein [Pseudorhodoplanes sp.]MCL4711979.1 hypothetical protein [Pseudorhodoplanes sp.]GIK79135.1 MAG: hypothetical protein BroJett024_02400 [Alphaproteobacteria bacterium]
MDIARVSIVIVLAACGLIDILLSSALILNGALGHALRHFADPKSVAILVLIAGGLAAPPLALAFFRRHVYWPALAIIVAPIALAAVASRLGI